MALLPSLSQAQSLGTKQIDQLISADVDSEDRLGSAVSISGASAVVGVPGDSDQFSQGGSAYVFVDSVSGWIEEAKLSASDAAPFNTFGEALSISGDTIVVGASGNGEHGAFAGAAYVFTRVAGVWSQEQKLLASDGAANDLFGFAVAIDGDSIVVGAFLDDDGGTNSGSAYVFVRNAGVWSQQSKLVPGDTMDRDNFGEAVAISGDTIICSSRHDDDDGFSSGSAYVFFRNATTWTQQAKLKANDAAGFDTFGSAVAVSGNTALVGASLEDQGGLNAGAAYVFVRVGTNWSQQAKLVALDAAPGDLLGFSVALDGERALLGALESDEQAPDSGSAYLFTRSGTLWTQQAELSAGDGAAFDEYARAVALEAERILVGAREHDQDSVSAQATGSSYIYLIGAAASQLARQAGANPNSLVVSDPVIGSNLQLSVDLSLSGHGSAAIFGFGAPASITLGGGQVLLGGGAQLFTLPLSPGPLANFNVLVPDDVSLQGVTLTIQALHLFGTQPFALSNAVDLTAGF